MAINVKSVDIWELPIRAESTRKDMKEFSGLMEMFGVLICIRQSSLNGMLKIRIKYRDQTYIIKKCKNILK